MPIHTNLKKGLLLIVLIGLLLIGMGLIEGFLPYNLRHAIHQRVEQVFPSPRYDPHPDIDWEFELDFRQHPWHRFVLWTGLGLLVLGDTYLIGRVLRALRRPTSPIPKP